MAATEITARQNAPYSAICYVQSEWKDGSSSRASAVVVGINDVLTALHVVYQEDHGGWATKVTIVPAADTQPISRPFGEYTDVRSMVGRTSNWDLNGDGLLSQTESAGDLALLGLGSRIGDVTGVLAVADVNADFYGQMVGYPARGSGMMADYVYADASSTAGVYNINAGLGAGASGGPLLYTINGVPTVVGVLSSGNSFNTNSTYAGLFGTGTFSWLQNAMLANDHLVAASAPTPATSVTTASGIIFTGGTGADTLAGSGGRDSFTGNAGNDTLNGGADIDTAIFTGPRANYTISVSGGTITVSDSVALRDGADTLISIERVKFLDMSVAFDTAGNAGMAYRLYKAAFDRAPDTAGLGFHINALDGGLGLEQVAANFIASPEFGRTYGSLSNSQFVNQLYVNVLDRAGDSAGIAYHLARLDSGSAGRSDVLAGFSESPENQAALIGTISTGMAYTS